MKNKRKFALILGGVVALLAVVLLGTKWVERATATQRVNAARRFDQVVDAAALILHDTPASSSVFGHNTLVLSSPRTISPEDPWPPGTRLIISERGELADYVALAVRHKAEFGKAAGGYAIPGLTVRVFERDGQGHVRQLDSAGVTYIEIRPANENATADKGSGDHH